MKFGVQMMLVAWTMGMVIGSLVVADEETSVYAPVLPPREDEGVNAGAVHTEVHVSYFSDYIFRGVERFDEENGKEDAVNLQFDGTLRFDLGKLPHPFVGVFVNVAENDPISNFQEIRPYLGFDWTVRPITFSAGHNTYIFPDRDALATTEFWGRIELDDSYFLRTDKPILSPYILAAYDYNLYKGSYFEAGVKHELQFEEMGITLRADAHVAYVRNMELFAGENEDGTGFQHYQVGLTAEYSLNHLLGVQGRYGQWTLLGYVYYTDGLSDDVRADTQLWGGTAIGFRY
jgi:hypothetical protein